MFSGFCRCPVWLFQRPRAQVQPSAVCGLCEVYTGTLPLRSSTVIFHASHKSEKPLHHRGLGFSGAPTWGWGSRNKSRLPAGREAGGEECDESCSEKFSPTVLTGSIFRLQYLARPIMQFIFPQDDTNDPANLFLWS